MLLFAASAVISLVYAAHQAVTDQPDFGAQYAGGRAVVLHRDPYDGSVISGIEASTESSAAAQGYAFLGPPPTALAMALFGMLPFRTASMIWFALIVAAQAACGIVVLRLVSPNRSAVLYAAATAAALDFAFGRNAIGLGQDDPIIAAVVLCGVALAAGGQPLRGGIVGGLATLKPQVLLGPALALAAGKRARILGGAVLGAGGLVLAAAVSGWLGASVASWGEWRALVAQARNRPTGLVLIGGIVAAAVAAVIFAVRFVWARRSGRPPSLIALVAAGTLVNAVVGPLIYLHLQSDDLVILPAGMLAAWVFARTETRLSLPVTFLTGIGAGCLLGNALSSVAYYAGGAHALLHLGITALLLGGVVCIRQALAPAAAIAIVVNTGLTVIPFRPAWLDAFAVAIALALLVLLGAVSTDPRWSLNPGRS